MNDRKDYVKPANVLMYDTLTAMPFMCSLSSLQSERIKALVTAYSQLAASYDEYKAKVILAFKRKKPHPRKRTKRNRRMAVGGRV